jgi:hypothetical protein
MAAAILTEFVASHHVVGVFISLSEKVIMSKSSQVSNLARSFEYH